MKEILIEYYSGAGNLFSILDNRNQKISEKQFSKLAKKVCSGSYPFTIRTEGFVILDNNAIPFGLYFYNPDGSSGMMCGNGARSAIRFALNNNFINAPSDGEGITFKLAGVDYSATLEDGFIKVKFPKHNFEELEKFIPFDNHTLRGSFADVGTLHLIFDYSDIPLSDKFEFDYYPLKSFAPKIRYNKELFPEGTNVSICKIIDEETILLRTYERGVEDETGACGTGAIAAALLNYKKGLTKSKVNIIPTSKSIIEVEILEKDGQTIGFTLKGDAVKIGEAKFSEEE